MFLVVFSIAVTIQVLVTSGLAIANQNFCHNDIGITEHIFTRSCSGFLLV
ncbi:MAG: hypothetical protein V7K98_17995 [Nostoc sp.]